jgi:hypothetical protein
MLTWNASEDPSGIIRYDWRLERYIPSESVGDYTLIATGSTAGLTAKVAVERGQYYRWRVRATDGAGNTGEYSYDAYLPAGIYLSRPLTLRPTDLVLN